MRTRNKVAMAGAVLGIASGLLFKTDAGRQVQFVLGGAMVNAGYRMQDHLEFDSHHKEDVTPEEIWQKVLKQNNLSSSVRSTFPRTARHPLVALVACMDARIDTLELMGDTRGYYYVLRTAGSVLSEREEDMLQLAVENGVKLVIWTTHSDCAAEKAASTEELRTRYPALAEAVDERDARVVEFLERPPIASRIDSGQLAVKVVDIDTMTDRLVPR